MQGDNVIDPPRSWNADGFHCDKFDWTLDYKKYPNYPFYIFGVYKSVHDIYIIFTLCPENKIGEFENNILKSTWSLTQEQIDNVKICFMINSKYIKITNNLVMFKAFELKNKADLFNKYCFYPVNQIINGLENINIKVSNLK